MPVDLGGHMNDDLRRTEAEWHRRQAVDLFNFTWTLIDKPDRTPAEDDQMIHAAHASRYHWDVVGTAVNYLRGDWQIARVYTLLHLPERAVHYAQLCLQQCRDHHIGDFDLAFAYEAVARALACAGEAAGAQEHYRLAERAGEQIAAEDDRRQFQQELRAGPWFDRVRPA
jgi:hypothetical protein